MSKRKRDQSNHEHEGITDGSERSLRLLQRQLDGTIDLGKKNIFRALKIGRGFERQKLGRRQKAAKEKQAEDEMARLVAEVATLKTLDLAATAELHLYKTLIKTKSVAASSIFPRYIHPYVDAASKPHDMAYANITARLFNSNPVKVAMAEVMTIVRGLLGIKEKEPIRNRRMRAADFTKVVDSEEKKLSKSDAMGIELDGSSHAASTRVRSNESLGLQGDHEEMNDQGINEYDHHISRLASISSLSISDDEEDIPVSLSEVRQSSYSPLGDKALSPPISQSSTELPRPEDKAKNPKSSTSGPTKSTTFLPSLMMGGYYSGSESGSIEDDGATDIKPRKNRMGQQARRQLWEKKFGHRANHIKKQSRDEGWDARKGAQGGDDRGLRGRRGGSGASWSRPRLSRTEDDGRASGANSDPIQGRRKKMPKAVDGPLHPSWEAAKKAKEEKGTVAFSGKKTVFD